MSKDTLNSTCQTKSFISLIKLYPVSERWSYSTFSPFPYTNLYARKLWISSSNVSRIHPRLTDLTIISPVRVNTIGWINARATIKFSLHQIILPTLRLFQILQEYKSDNITALLKILQWFAKDKSQSDDNGLHRPAEFSSHLSSSSLTSVHIPASCSSSLLQL